MAENETQSNTPFPCTHDHLLPGTICTFYNAAANTAIRAPIAATNEPEITFPALVPEGTFNPPVEEVLLSDPDAVVLGLGDPVVTEPLPPADPDPEPLETVALDSAAVVVTLAEPSPLPAPVGERPLPDETTADPEADVEAEAEAEADPEAEPVALADALLELEEEVMLEQERS